MATDARPYLPHSHARHTQELNGVVADIVTAKKAAFDKVARPALAGSSGAGAKQVAKAKPKGKGLAR